MYAYQNELYHYGVLGMKWGVRRATRQLSGATNTKQYDHAVNRLNSHRSKSVNKVNKLTKRIDKLQKKSERDAATESYKAASLSKKAAKLRKKSHAIIRIKSFDGIREWRASRLDNKSETMKLKIEKTKKSIMKNESMKKIFDQGIQGIDKALIENGKRLLNS